MHVKGFSPVWVRRCELLLQLRLSFPALFHLLPHPRAAAEEMRERKAFLDYQGVSYQGTVLKVKRHLLSLYSLLALVSLSPALFSLVPRTRLALS